MEHYNKKVSLKVLSAQYGITVGALKMKIHRWKNKIARELDERRWRPL